MSYKWVDSHCHFMPDYTSEEQVLEAIKGLENLEFAINIGTEIKDFSEILSRVRHISNLYGTLGIHPCNAYEYQSDIELFIKQEVQNSKIKAIGEIGLDFFHNDNPPKQIQIPVFEKQLQLALDCNMPVVIHARDSIMECLEVLKNFRLTKPLVFHCFTGTLKEAEAILNQNFWISYTGVITYPKTQEIQQAVTITPQDKIMVETDSPFIAPVPYRGKKNQPEWVSFIGEKVAELKGWSIEEARQITTQNAYYFFDI